MAGQVFLSFASAFFMRCSEEGKLIDENHSSVASSKHAESPRVIPLANPFKRRYTGSQKKSVEFEREERH